MSISAPIPNTLYKKYNKNDLSLPNLMVSDFLSAFIAGGISSPIVKIVDTAVVKATAGTTTMGRGMLHEFQEMCTRPQRFFRRPELFLVWGVYSITYLAANWCDTLCQYKKFDQHESQIAKLLGVTSINMTACIVKDRAFARNFGTGAPRALPLSTYGLFLTRDTITMGSSFNLPEIVSNHILDNHNNNNNNNNHHHHHHNKSIVLGGMNLTESQIHTGVQILLPGCFQLITTPIHMLALDKYNRPGATLQERYATISGLYKSTVFSRILRLTWSFGIGGVGNKNLRNYFNEQQHDLLIHTPTIVPSSMISASTASSLNDFKDAIKDVSTDITVQQSANCAARAISSVRSSTTQHHTQQSSGTP